MRVFEIILTVLIFLLAIQTFLPSFLGGFNRKLLMGWFGIVAGALIPIHAPVEGLRWQMIPIYLLTA